MNNQIVEISCEDLELVSGGDFKDGITSFGQGLVKPLGFYGTTKVKTSCQWSYKDVGDCSLGDEGLAPALGTVITDIALFFGIAKAGNFVLDKIKSLLN